MNPYCAGGRTQMDDMLENRLGEGFAHAHAHVSWEAGT